MSNTNISKIKSKKTGEVYDIEDSYSRSEISSLKSAIESGSSLTSAIKSALLQIAQKVAYIDDDGQTYYDDLYDALYPPIVYTAITLNKNSLSFGSLNSTQQLTATTTPRGGAVTWTSSNPSVATVSQTGLVTAIAYGNATITASCGSLTATCSVAISQATVTSISAVYAQGSKVVYNNDSLDSLKNDLTVTASWSNGTTSTVAKADYTLSGTLTVGTSTITVSYGGQSTTFNVYVTDAGLTTSAYITIANETPVNGYINDSGEIGTAANNYFIDKFYEALPFAFTDASAFIKYTALRGAYYDSNKNFLSRDYNENVEVKPVSNTSAVYEKIGWNQGSTGSTPTYAFLLKEIDTSLFTNTNSSIDATGALISASGQVATDLIAITGGESKFVIPSVGPTGSVCRVAFYDSSQVFISRYYNGSSLASGKTPYGDIPSNAAYFRMDKPASATAYYPIARGI